MENRIHQTASGFGHRQAGEDYYERYYNVQAIEHDLGILGEIIYFVIEVKIPDFEIEYAETLKHETQLPDKIPLNCENEEEIDELNDMFKTHWGMIMQVGTYLGDIEDQGKILRLREYIKSQYRTLKQSSRNIIETFDNLPFSILPREKASNPDYNIIAKSVVLYFFEQCDIGKKTATESGRG